MPISAYGLGIVLGFQVQIKKNKESQGNVGVSGFERLI